MQALRGLVVGCAVLLVAGQAYGDAKDDAAKLLVGKWEIKEKIVDKDATAVLDFTKDGKMSMKMSGFMPEDLNVKGKYKVVDKETIEVTITSGDKTRTEKSKFKVTKDTLELTGKDGKSQKFNRIK